MIAQYCAKEARVTASEAMKNARATVDTAHNWSIDLAEDDCVVLDKNEDDNSEYD